jgi:hypothetical protein
LMTAGCAQLSPLCPGSITTTWPASGRLGTLAPAEGAPTGVSPGPVVTGPEATGAAGAVGDDGAGVPEQAASRPARVPATARAAARGALPRTLGRPETLPARPHTQLKATFLTRLQVCAPTLPEREAARGQHAGWADRWHGHRPRRAASRGRIFP